MAIQYKEIEATEPIPFSYIEATYEDGSIVFIPKDPSNADYQRYLNPEAEQSTPILSDEAKTK